MWNFLTFRKMLFPVLIQVIFWVGTIAFVVTGLMVMSGRMAAPEQVNVLGDRVKSGLALLILGPLLLRLYCELMIVFFRMNDTLTDIRDGLKRK